MITIEEIATRRKMGIDLPPIDVEEDEGGDDGENQRYFLNLFCMVKDEKMEYGYKESSKYVELFQNELDMPLKDFLQIGVAHSENFAIEGMLEERTRFEKMTEADFNNYILSEMEDLSNKENGYSSKTQAYKAIQDFLLKDCPKLYWSHEDIYYGEDQSNPFNFQKEKDISLDSKLSELLQDNVLQGKNENPSKEIYLTVTDVIKLGEEKYTQIL